MAAERSKEPTNGRRETVSVSNKWGHAHISLADSFGPSARTKKGHGAATVALSFGGLLTSHP